MKKTVLMLVVMSAMVIVACGIAFAASRMQITRLQCDAPDNDHVTLNSEYVVFKNTSAQAAKLGGFRVYDAGRIHTYRFPTGSKLGPFGSVTLHTGKGRNGGGHLYWGRSSAVWNNTGDTATLTDRSGRVLDRLGCSDR